MLRLTIIIVNWNVRELLRRCLVSVAADVSEAGLCLTPPTVKFWKRRTAEVVVVDNASSDGSIDMLRKDFSWVRLIANQKNRGFGAANNQAIAGSASEYLLLLNPDTELRPGAVRRLVTCLDCRPDVACAGPRLLNADGSMQPSRRSFPHLATAFVESTILQRHLGGIPAVRNYYLSGTPEDREQQVDWVVGACMMLRRSALDQVGGFDERFFMYSEEMDLCYRLKRAGHRVWYVPQAEVIHHEAASSRQDLFRQNINFHQSRYGFFRKHHGTRGAEALRWFTFGTYLFQIAEETGKLLLQPSKHALRKARLKLYLRIAKWYLSGS